MLVFRSKRYLNTITPPRMNCFKKQKQLIIRGFENNQQFLKKKTVPFPKKSISLNMGKFFHLFQATKNLINACKKRKRTITPPQYILDSSEYLKVSFI